MLVSKLHSGTSKTMQLVPVHLDLPLVKILYYFISLFICFICDGNLLLLREDPSQIWNRWKHPWSGHPDGFEEISLVSACRSISTYSGLMVFSLCERGELHYVRTPDEYRLLIIFSASGFPVIIKFHPATCNLCPAKYTCRPFGSETYIWHN